MNMKDKMKDKIKDKVSVITTFFNSEKYILQCIHSVNSQLTNDEFNIEYIIVDDNSKDSSNEIVELYFQKTPSKLDIHLIKTPDNLGCGGARNFGIKHSSGNYLMFLDSDDYYLYNDFIYKAHDLITKYNADIVEFGISYVDGVERRTSKINNPIIIENNKIAAIKAMFLDASIKFSPWSKIIKREIINTKEYSNDREYEDIKTTPYWIYNSNKILIWNSVDINYRNANNSIVNNDTNSLGILKAISTLFEYFKDNEEILKAFYNRCEYILRYMLDVDSDDETYKQMSKINTYMLSYIYPNIYKEITYDVE